MFKIVLSDKRTKLLVWAAIAFILMLLFLVFTSEVRESDAGQPELVGMIDKSVAEVLSKTRSQTLTNIFIEISALGSVSFLTIAVILGVLFFSLSKNYLAGVFLVITTSSAGLLSQTLKGFFERPRPSLERHLVFVDGFSYPSGHSLGSAAFYLMLALLVSEFYPGRTQRLIIFFVSTMLILLIGFSRIYLGVHYPTDVAAGILLGAIWALLSAIIKFAYERR